jgi:hypothetical protein
MSAYRVISPWYITGFTEGEGCFAILLTKHKTKKLGKDANLCFEIELRIDEKPILELIQKRLQCGRIVELHYDRYGWKPHVKFVVRKQYDIFYKVIPFFKTFPLQGKKRKDFLLFCKAAELFKKKKHLTEKGIVELQKLRTFMNDRRLIGG